MNRWVRILVVQSGKELFRYKSFFLLVFVLIVADWAIKRFVHVDRSALHLPELKQASLQTAGYVFEKLPAVICRFLSDYRTFLVLAALFLLKQLISMWPSSDMRRMHRAERGAFGLISSLLALRWEQIVWDAIAVSTVCGLTALWGLCAFTLTRMLWQVIQSPIWLGLLLLLMFLFSPVTMAGFSYSSKLAVISRGRFGEKLSLFFKLFSDAGILRPSWIFFLFRITIESVFVLALPAMILLVMDIAWARILLATLLATPVYSYLKMASFKFFLEIYGRFDIVRAEYPDYYNQ